MRSIAGPVTRIGRRAAMLAWVAGVLAVGVAPARSGAPSGVLMVSCRAVPPSTVQLIWRGSPGVPVYTVELTRAREAGRAAEPLLRVTTSDTTWTHAGLPAGELHIRVRESVHRGDAQAAPAGAEDHVVTVPVPGSQPVACH